MNRLTLLLIIYFNACLLISFPISEYDFRLPTSVVSPVEAAYGGVNVASNTDFYLVFNNPALLATVRQTTFSASFVLPPNNYQEITSVLNTTPFLENNKFRGFSFQGKQIGLGYLVLTEDKFKRTETNGNQTYQDYKINSYLLGFSDSIDSYHWGINLKLLSGRLVYLEQEKIYSDGDSLLSINTFIDSRALGYSSDLGISTSKHGISYGLVFNDLLSKIYWKGHSSGEIRTRVTTSVDYTAGNYSFGIGANNRWNINTKPFLNSYYAYRFNFGRPDDIQTASMRFGVCSRDFENQDSILFNMGFGYMFRMMKVDIALQSQGWKANQTQYLFSLSLGE